MGTKEVVSVSLPKDRVRMIERIAEEEKVDKSTILERAVENYIREWFLKKALNSYTSGEVTLSRAAEIAGITIWEMIDEISKRKITTQYDVKDFEEDLKNLSHEE